MRSAIYLHLLKRALTRYPLLPLERWMVFWLAGLDPAMTQAITRWAQAGPAETWFDPRLRALGLDWPAEAETMIGLSRLDNLEHCVVDVLRRRVPGDLAETGVWRGGASIFMRGALRAYGDTGRTVWVADSFQGLPKPDAASYPADEGSDLWAEPRLAISLDEVKRNFERYGLLDDHVRFVPGWFRETLPTAAIDQLAVLRLDGDMYESTIVALRSLYDKVARGGYVIVDDYGSVPPCRRAVDDFRNERGIEESLLPVDWTGVYWQVASEPPRRPSWPGMPSGSGALDHLGPRPDTLVIDSGLRTLTAIAKGRPVTMPLYSAAAFREISRQWMRVGWSLHHYAGFTWMGQHVLQLPDDLIRLQEAVFAVRPDLILETGVAYGGSLLYLATLCRALGKGRVIGVEIQILPQIREAIERHVLAPHIRLIEGDSTSPAVLGAIRDAQQPGETVMVILDSAHDRSHVRRELESYAPFVTPGSYLIVEDGIMLDLFDVPGGEPGWVLDNPVTAVAGFLAEHPEFRLCRPPGTDRETVNVSYWTAGWLKRVR